MFMTHRFIALQTFPSKTQIHANASLTSLHIWNFACPKPDSRVSINNMRSSHMMARSSVIRTKGWTCYMWMHLEDTSLVEEAGHKRPHIVWLHLYEMPRRGQSVEMASGCISGCLGWGVGTGSNCKWAQGIFFIGGGGGAGWVMEMC